MQQTPFQPGPERSALSRLIRNPIAIVGALGSIFVVLANAGPAIDGAGDLWRRWTESPSLLDTTWQGDWKSRDGYHYAFAMQLGVAATDEARGEINWQLVATPSGSHIANRVGDSAIEYVSGRYDRNKRLATLAGYKVSDESLLALDTYKFQIKSDNITFVGMTKHRGQWEAEAGGTVIVTETK
jgi:hypothetical protein